MEAGRGSRTVCFAPDGAPWCPLKYNELILSIIVHSMQIAEELAGVDMRLEAGAIRFVACFSFDRQLLWSYATDNRELHWHNAAEVTCCISDMFSQSQNSSVVGLRLKRRPPN